MIAKNIFSHCWGHVEIFLGPGIVLMDCTIGSTLLYAKMIPVLPREKQPHQFFESLPVFFIKTG